jgi:CubicO group peptidase (beta-lactamase class C family)
MLTIHRRKFGTLALSLLAKASSWTALNDSLRKSASTRKIPAVAAMVAGPDRIFWSGAFGTRDSASGIAVKPDSIFAIASMTKAITTAPPSSLSSAAC